MPDLRLSRCVPAPKRLALAASLAALAALALPAAAQYKVVGPDGRVTYTDRPPADASVRVSRLQREAAAAAPPAADALPPALRQPAARFPVTLYSTADCPPCDAGRQLLQRRGVPFNEKLVASEDDVLAMERMLGSRSVPALTIGTQALRGLSEAEWAAYLDAAGYPRESQLPKEWQAPPAVPLVARNAAVPASAPSRAVVPPRRVAPAAPPSPPALEAPAPGTIRF